MKYHVDYQFLPKGALRPIDDGEIVGIEATDEGGVVILPNVGDYIEIDNSTDGGKRSAFNGKVRSRLFRYIRVFEPDLSVLLNDKPTDHERIKQCQEI